MLKIFLRIVLVLLATPCRAEVSESLLFDGSSLAGWRQTGEVEWRVADGVIEAQGSGAGFLVTSSRFSDFTLTVDFWVDGTTNSGVFVGCPDQGEINPKVCYEINIWDRHPQPPARTGSIVFEVMPPLVHVDTIGKWNRYEITVSGARIAVTLNGSVTAIMSEARPGPGYIALQHANTGTVRFRAISLSKTSDNDR